MSQEKKKISKNLKNFVFHVPKTYNTKKHPKINENLLKFSKSKESKKKVIFINTHKKNKIDPNPLVITDQEYQIPDSYMT